MLVGHISPFHPPFQSYYDAIRTWFHTQGSQLAAPSAALDAIYREVLRQASMLAFNDTFWMLCFATALLIPITLLFRRGQTDGREEVPL